MAPFSRCSLVRGLVAAGALAFCATPSAMAAVVMFIHESMAMGSTGTGSSVSFGEQAGPNQFISATRFDIPTGMFGLVDAVGGHMSGGNPGGTLMYTAILRLPGPGTFPSDPGNTNPFASSTIVAANAFSANGLSNSRDVRITFPDTGQPLALAEGSYALVFGAGGTPDELLFGPGGFVQPSANDITDGNLASGFFLQFPTNGTITDSILRWNSFSNSWTLDSSNNNIRLYVEGEISPIPEPGSAILMGSACFALVFFRRRRRR